MGGVAGWKRTAAFDEPAVVGHGVVGAGAEEDVFQHAGDQAGGELGEADEQQQPGSWAVAGEEEEDDRGEEDHRAGQPFREGEAEGEAGVVS